MPIFLTPKKAKKEIEYQKNFLRLVDSYDADTIDKYIILQYAKSGSGKKIYRKLYSLGLVETYQEVMEVIKSEPRDSLHKIVRQDYLTRTRKARNRIRDFDESLY